VVKVLDTPWPPALSNGSSGGGITSVLDALEVAEVYQVAPLTSG